MGMKEYYAAVQQQLTESATPEVQAPPAPEKSLLSDAYEQFKLGFVGQGAKSLGALGQAVSPVGSSFYEAAKEFREVGESALKDPDNAPAKANTEGLRGLVTSGAFGVGQMVPVLTTALLTRSPVLAAGAGGALYGGSTYQETKERGLAKYGLDDAYAAAHPEDPRVQEAKRVGAVSGAIQGGGEFAMDMLWGKTIKGVVPSVFKKTATEVAQSYVKPKTLQNFLKAWGVGAVAEGATEAIQDESQAAVERAYGLPDTPKFGEQAGESFEGGFATALALGPLAAFGTKAQSKFKTQQAALLANPEADVNARLRAATIIGADIAKDDPKAAMIFVERAEDAIRNPRPYALKLDESVFTPLSELEKIQDEEAAKAPEPSAPVEETQLTPEQAAIDQAWEQEAQRVAAAQEEERAAELGEIVPGKPRAIAETPQVVPATNRAEQIIDESKVGFAPSEYSRFGEMQTQGQVPQGTAPQLRGRAATPQAQPATDRVSQIKQEIAAAAPRLAPTVSSTALPEVSTVTQAVRDAGNRVGSIVDAARAAGITKSQDVVKLAKDMGYPMRVLSADIKTLGLSKPSDLLKLEVQNAIEQERGAELQGTVPQEQAISEAGGQASTEQRADSRNRVEQEAQKIDGRQALVERRKVVKAILDAHTAGTDVLTEEDLEGYTAEYEDLRREISGFNDRFSRSEAAPTGAKAAQVQKWLGSIPNVIVLDDFTQLFADKKNQSAEAVARRATGKIYVNASKMKSAQHARDIVFDHELRHFGLSKMFGGSAPLAKEMEKAFKGREAEVIAFALERGYTRSVAEATEEYIVSKAREAKEQGFLGKVVAALRGWARSNGFGSLSYSNAEILKMVRESGTVIGVIEGEDRFARPETKQEIDAIFAIANEEFKTSVTKARRPKGGIHIERLADLFGKPVVWYNADRNFNGFGAPGGRTIFLNADSRNPVLQIFGHELSHKLYRDDPAAYAALEEYTLARTDKADFDEYTSLMTDRALAKVEFVGDVVGSAFAKKEFWTEFEAKEPTLFARVISAVRSVLNRAAKIASNFYGADTLVAEIAAVDKMIAQTFAQYAKNQQARSEDRFARGESNEFTTGVLEEARRTDEGGNVAKSDAVASGISGPEFDDRTAAGARVGATEAGGGVQQTIGGENEAERLRSEANAAELSVPFQAAFDVYRGNGGSSRENLGALKRYASEKGLIVGGDKFYAEWEKGKKIKGGENKVIFKAGYAEKLNDLGYHKGDIGAFLRRMVAHNGFFPDAAYELVGFVEQGERLLPMTRQKFVAAATDVKTSLTQIEKELTERGFKLIDREGGMWLTPDGRFEMFDAGRSNVITDAEGNLHFIDAVFLPVKGVEDRYSRPFNKQEAMDEIKSYGPSLLRLLSRFSSWLQPLNRRYDSLQYATSLTDEIKDVVRQMAEQSNMQRSEQNRVLSTTKEATDQWMKAGKAGDDLPQSMELAFNASLLQLYPGKSMVDQGWGDTPEAASKAWNKAVGAKQGKDFATEYSRITKEFNALSPATRKAYLGVVDVMSDLRTQLHDAYLNTIDAMPVEEEKKRALRRTLERNFRNLKGAYMPFTRHGEYVANVYDKTADGKLINSTRAATMGELRAQVELLKAQYPADRYEVRKFDGRVIHKAKENRISPALLEQMKGMLVDNLNQAGFSKVHRLAKQFLEDNVEQLSDDQRDLVKAIYKAGNLKSQAAAINALRDNVIDSYELVDFIQTMDTARERLTDNPGLTKAIDDLEQIFLDTLPDTSALKSSMHRKGTAGWSSDAIRSVLDYANRYGKSLAYMKHGRQVDQLEAEASRLAEGIINPDRSLKAQTLLKDTFENRRVVSEEEVGALGKFSTKLGSLWFLTSPSMILVQNSQPWAITVPYLAARYGLGDAVSAMTRNHVTYQLGGKFTDDKINAFDADLIRAPKDWNTNLPFSLSRFYAAANGETKAKILKSLTADEKNMLALRLGMDTGVIANSMSFEAVEYARKGASGQIGTALDTAAEKAYFFQRFGETLSRKGAYMAAFELATKAGDSFDEANRKAIRAVNETLYDYSATNRPRIISGTFGRFFGQFRTYQLQTWGHMLNLFAKGRTGDKAAVKELGLLMATNFVLAGATGLPLAGSLATMLGAVGFLMGEDDDWVKEIEEELLKTKAGQVVLKGAPMILGLDLSRRIGMEGLTHIFQGEAPAKATPKDQMNFYASQILGPAYAASAGAAFNIGQAIQDGDWGKAFEQGTPRAIASAFQAMKLNNKGLTDGSGRVIIPEDKISKWDVALMMIGVNPGQVSVAREKEKNIREVTDMVDLKKQRLAKDLERAVLDNDGAAIEKSQAAIQRFNQQYPMFGFTSQALASRLRGAWQERAGITSRKYQAAELYLDRYDEEEEA